MIPLLGMHRSGTSAFAGALHKLGADLGPESSWLYPAADNPLGFFEYRAVVNVNRDVLAAMGGTWSSPPPLPPGWVDDDRIKSHRERVGEFAATLPADMVAKDPRLSLVQPLWDAVSPLRPALLCIRHPAAVAGSLQARNELTLDQTLYLWFRYNASAILCRPDALVVQYERILDDPESELRRSADHIGLEVTDTSVAAATSWLHRDMAHHGPDGLPASPITEICMTLYRALRSGQRLDDLHDLRVWAQLATMLPWATESKPEVERSLTAVKRSEREIERLRDANQRLGTRADRLETELRQMLTLVDDVSVSTVEALLDAKDGERS